MNRSGRSALEPSLPTACCTAAVPRRLAAAASLLLAVACGGCGTPAVIGPPEPGAPPSETTDSTAVGPDVARILELGTAGQSLRYRLVNGGEANFVLGPIYQSSRGLLCRIGRVSPDEAGYAGPTSYPFCRIDNRWYAMKPVVVGGY
jgi:hypothetical protein